MSIETIITAMLALSTGILGWMQFRAEARKKRTESKVDDAEVTKKIGEAYSELIAAMNQRMDDMQEEIDRMKLELRKYRNWTAQLLKQLMDNNIVPIEPPDTGELNKGQK